MTAQQSISKGLSNNKITTKKRTCNYKHAPASTPIQMEIVFGRPSKDCEDIGICRINLVTDLPQASEQHCFCKKKAIALVTQQRNGQLLFRFPKNQMSQKTKITQFANRQFTVSEPFILPEPLQRLFCPRIIIEAGVYAVKEDKDTLIIEM